MGTRVFVCDNLAFTGEVKLSRKHTRFAVRDLRFMTSRAVGRLGEQFHREDERIAAYKRQRLTDKAAHDLLIRAVDCPGHHADRSAGSHQVLARAAS